MRSNSSNIEQRFQIPVLNRMKISRLFSVLATSLSFAVTAQAGEIYTFDPNHSSVGFKIRHLFSDVSGRFNEFNGTVNVDAEKPENSVVDVTIQTKSIDTANAKRDGHLRSADFFHVEKNPTMTFKSKKVVLIGDKSATVTGDLTLNGVTKEVSLTVTFLGKGKGMDGKEVSGWSATGELNRTEFGLTWNKAVEGSQILGDIVKVEIQVEAHAQ